MRFPPPPSLAAARPRAPRRRLDERRRRRGRPPGCGRGERGRARRTPPSSARRSSPTPPTTSSTAARATPYLESDSPSPHSAYGMTKLHGEAAAGERAWVIRSSWLFGPTGHNFVRTMLRLGAERDEVAVVADQRGCPTYVGHLAAATRELVAAAQPVRHLAPRGRRRLHLGRFRRGDLRGGGARLPGPADHDGGVRRPRPAARRARSCAARRARRSCRTGATASPSASPRSTAAIADHGGERRVPCDTLSRGPRSPASRGRCGSIPICDTLSQAIVALPAHARPRRRRGCGGAARMRRWRTTAS